MKSQSYTEFEELETVKPNPPSNAVCAKKCKRREEDNLNINGMIYYEDTKECMCVIGMKGVVQQAGSDICYFGNYFL